MAGKAERQEMTAADITLNWISFDHVAAFLETHLLPSYGGAALFFGERPAVFPVSRGRESGFGSQP